MLTVRSFRNNDPPRLLELWQKSQSRPHDAAPLISLSLNQLQSQVLGLPMQDHQSIMLAFDEKRPVGYVHTAFVPTQDGYSFDPAIGQICFLCVDPDYFDVAGAAAVLLRAGEEYLIAKGAQKIFGGSPSPSAPFYTGFYSGGEAVGILHADKTMIDAFQGAHYCVHQKTSWFYFDLRNYSSSITAEVAGYYDELQVEIYEVPAAKTWWEGCSLAHGIWFDATASLIQTHRPVARLRTRITYPDTGSILAMYGRTWHASLMELRVHPDFTDEGIKRYLLSELVHYLALQNQIVQIEAHVSEDSPLFSLLHKQGWQVRGTGSVFVKNVDQPPHDSGVP